MRKNSGPSNSSDLPAFQRGELVEYHGKTSKHLPRATVVAVFAEATTQKTVVEALTAEGRSIQIVLANKHLRKHKCLF